MKSHVIVAVFRNGSPEPYTWGAGANPTQARWAAAYNLHARRAAQHPGKGRGRWTYRMAVIPRGLSVDESNARALALMETSQPRDWMYVLDWTRPSGLRRVTT